MTITNSDYTAGIWETLTRKEVGNYSEHSLAHAAMGFSFGSHKATVCSSTESGASAFLYSCSGTNDQVVINAAITAVSAAGGGEVILLPGNYSTSSAIVHKDNVNLYCPIKHGAHVTLAAFTSTTYAALAQNTLSNVWISFDPVSGNGCQNFRVANIIFDGNRSNQAYAIASLDVGAATDSILNGMKFFGTSGTPCRNFIAEDNKCINSIFHGIFLVDNCYDFDLVGNECTGNGYRGIHCHGGGTSLALEGSSSIGRYLVSQNRIHANGTSVNTTQGASGSASINTGLFAVFDNSYAGDVVDNWIWDERGCGLQVSGLTASSGDPSSRMNVVRGNNVFFCGIPLFISLGAKDAIIEGNHFGYGMANFIIYVTAQGSGYTSAPTCAISGCDATFVPIVEGGKIRAIVCTSNGTTGIAEGAKTMTITGGGGTGATASAYCHAMSYSSGASGDGGIVGGNTSTDEYTAYNLTIDNNHFHHNLRRGLTVAGKAIKGSNKIYENGGDGLIFLASGTVDQCNMQETESFNNAGWGVKFDSTGVIIRTSIDDSRVYQNNGGGIQALAGGSGTIFGISARNCEVYSNNNYQMDADTCINFDFSGGRYDNGRSLYTGQPYRIRATCDNGKIKNSFHRRNSAGSAAYQILGTNLDVGELLVASGEIGGLATAAGAGLKGMVANAVLATTGAGTTQAKITIQYVHPTTGALTTGYLAITDTA